MADDAINNAAAETVENGQKEPSDDRGRDTTSPPVASTISPLLVQNNTADRARLRCRAGSLGCVCRLER